MAAAVIGCGGGGGGGTAGGGVRSDLTTGGAVSTGGEITTGGTTGAAVTTGGGGTTGAPVVDPPPTPSTTGTVDPPPAPSTTGTATTGTPDPTTGGTTGTPDLPPAPSTTGTVEPATTGTIGVSDPTTGGTPGGPPSPLLPPPGYRRSNAIYFGHYVDGSLVSSVLPDGTARLDEGGGSPDIVAAIADPALPGGLIYAAQVDGQYGIYRGTSFDPAASQTLAPPTFDYVTALQATADGSVAAVATSGGVTSAYSIEYGAAFAIDAADDLAMRADGSQVAYSKWVGDHSDLYLWTRSSGQSVALNTGGDAILPSFSKDGNWLLFSSNRDRGYGNGAYDLYQISTTSGAVERITDTPTVDELGACYDETRTRIAYVALSVDPAATGVFVLSNLGAYRVAADDDVTLATYWTDTDGRSRGGRQGFRFQRVKPRKPSTIARARHR